MTDVIKSKEISSSQFDSDIYELSDNEILIAIFFNNSAKEDQIGLDLIKWK